MTRLLLVGLLLAGIGACELRSSVTEIEEILSTETEDTVALTWRGNEPAGLSELTDNNFDTHPSPWSFAEKECGPDAHSVGTDADAPVSASNVLEVEACSTLPDGQEPGVTFISLGNVREWYMAYVVKLEDGYDYDSGMKEIDVAKSTGVFSWTDLIKNGFSDTDGGTFSVDTYWGITWTPDQDGAGSHWRLPWNVGGANSGSLTRGQWHQVEVHVVVQSSAGAGDGEARLWLDGNLILEHTDIDYGGASAHPTYGELQIAHTHGGGGSGRSGFGTQYIWYDHFYISTA